MSESNGFYLTLDPRLPQHKPESCALAVMVKAPCSGNSKTRLVPPLTPAEAANLSACFLRDTSANIGEISRDGVEGVVVFTPTDAESTFKGLLPESFSLLAQRGESLGDRLYFAAQDLLSVGYESLCLINSDSPTLPQAHLRAAVSELARPGDRVVLGEATDGGYYLIGLKSSHRHLFTNIDWSTSRVLAQTIERAAEINLEVVLLPDWYDVDDGTTLRALCDELFSTNGPQASQSGIVPYHASYTHSYLRSIIRTDDDRQRIWGTDAKFAARYF